MSKATMKMDQKVSMKPSHPVEQLKVKIKRVKMSMKNKAKTLAKRFTTLIGFFVFGSFLMGDWLASKYLLTFNAVSKSMDAPPVWGMMFLLPMATLLGLMLLFVFYAICEGLGKMIVGDYCERR